MTSVVRGAYKRYFGPALAKVFGTEGRLADFNVAGMTDLQIAAESLKAEGITVDEIKERMLEVMEIFPVEMRRILGDEKTHVLLPGLPQILDETKENPRYVDALLTGNIMPAARIKLERVGIDSYFDYSISAFGEISANRNDLPFAAQERADAKFDYKFSPSQFIVIGDTPFDIACAKNFGAKVVAVATGRDQTWEGLEKLQPDFLLKDLSDTDEVMSIFESV